MGIGLIGKKLGMTQIYDDNGKVVPVTVIESEPNPIVQVKTKEKDGYSAVKLGYGDVKEKSLRKPQQGSFKKAGLKPKKVLREFRTEDKESYSVGQEIKVDLFKPGDFVDISGVSIGKGFQGGVKRWHWHGGKGSRGSMHHRAPGSIGASSDPSRVYKGHHLPGRMGGDTITVQNLRVMKVDPENNTIAVKGAVPGHDNTILIINRSIKKNLEELRIKEQKRLEQKKKELAKKKLEEKKAAK